MAVDWKSAAADHDPRAVKAAVDLAAVLLSYGIDLEPQGDRLVGKCPFHEDDRPSFGVWKWDDGTQSCGCWACDFDKGDLFDFLQRFHDCSFREAMAKALELRDAELPDVPEAATYAEPAPDLGELYAKARSGPTVLLELLNARSIPVPADWLQSEFQVRVAGSEVVIPHYDDTQRLVAIKRRTESAGWVPIAVRGSALEALYGAWRGRRRHEVVLCEGESDTWTVAWLLRDEPVDVFGLPSGVSARPREAWLEACRGKDVTILFDADRAGRAGAAAWAAKLVEPASSVRVAGLPDGADATSAGYATVQRCLAEAWRVVDISSIPIQISGERYTRQNANETVTVLSDFVLDVQRLISMDEGGAVFEVGIPTRQQPQQLTDAELSSSDRMRRWCAERLLAWKGSARDLSDLLELLKAQALWVPRVRGTDVVGLHGESFVLPTETIGPAGWGYVPPENDVDLDKGLRLGDGQWDAMIPHYMAQLHSPDVVTPILGWVAAAPLRSICAHFPVLAVTGGSGWGKTTLVQAVLETFGFWCVQPTTLTGTTAHGVQSYAGCTNAIPVWIDEYRHGARLDAKFALDQVIRDAWDGSASVKGGMSENRMRIKKLPARAPLIVTGEDTFSETSHAERMVMVPISKVGKNPTVLSALMATERVGFGRTYVQWLMRQLAAGELTAPPNLNDRPMQARAIARWGYGLLDQFCQEVLEYRLIPFDESRIAAQHRETDREPVILEAIIESVGLLDRSNQQISWVDGEDLCVKVQSLCQYVKNNTDLQMPGGSRAVGAWLVEQYDGTHERHQIYGRILRLPGMAASVQTSGGSVESAS